LQDKLESVREEVGGKKIELLDETVAEVLRECELCLTNVMRRIKAADDEKKRSKMTSMSASKSSKDRDEESKMELDDDLNLSSLRPYNQRIDLDADEGTFTAHTAHRGVYFEVPKLFYAPCLLILNGCLTF
jgi:hypothetical protein